MHGTFYFVVATVTGLTYLDMLEGWLLSQLKKDFPWQLSFQQNEAAPHFKFAEGLFG
jgi:hypothetical protein